ncbi:TIGR03086 family protein [Microbispora sp. RL4-1S]|uniref:TIGR03086 family protein n=1 Tax=Microbispora oryzae TaxID=2806554 RepID=A0A941AR03_9ACTN|nr:TIGR03086 family metal-binding protein [Microbispora oryzae]MBP2705374.1 TIGR03086 family protein [Microbispora oryzae]
MSENTVANWRALLDGAHEGLRRVVAGIGVDGWDLPTPCEKWSVTQVLQHAAGDQAAFTAAVTGGAWPSEDPFSPSGHIDGDPLAYLARILETSAAAWAEVGDEDEQVPTPLPQGVLPAWLASGACAMDAAVHAWDIAVATGQPSPLSEDAARSLRTVAIAIVEPLRAYGAYAPALDPAPQAGEVETLLGFLGRRADWTAAE